MDVGETTVPSDTAYDSSAHHTVSDLATDSANCPSFIIVTVKQYKMVPFRRGVDLFVGQT